MAQEVRDRSLSIGRVFSGAFGVIGQNPLVVLGIMLLCVAVPQVFALFVMQTMVAQIMVSAQGGAVEPTDMSAYWGMFAGYGILGFVLGSIAVAALTHATVAREAGLRASFGDCLGKAFGSVLPLIGLSLLLVIAIWLGMLLLLVPGIILAVMWSVALPALAAENDGVFAAFARSSALTKGVRWKIFGLFMLVILIFFGFSIVAGIASVFVRLLIPAVAASLVANALSTIALMTVYFLVQASLYVELRETKDGPATDSLAEIFG